MASIMFAKHSRRKENRKSETKFTYLSRTARKKIITRRQFVVAAAKERVAKGL